MGLSYREQLEALPEDARLWHARNIYDYRLSGGASPDDALEFTLSVSSGLVDSERLTSVLEIWRYDRHYNGGKRLLYTIFGG
ncbi:hypothetical protein FACS1894187_05140 [Synergistales bacterium]|nr:hypothetical protein FACS1894187_05140 [Synergistales bacterium]